MKRAIQLTTNLSHVHSTTSKPASTQEMDIASYRSNLLMGIEKVQMANDRDTLIESLKKFSNLCQLGIPMSMRPCIFQQLIMNGSDLMVRYLKDKEVFNAYFTLLNTLKAQLDSKPQRSPELQDIEWQELQKLIYILSDWEDFAAEGQQEVGASANAHPQ
jgi:hypothetical protein